MVQTSTSIMVISITGQTLGIDDICPNLQYQPDFIIVAVMNPFNQKKMLTVAASVDVVMLSLDCGDTTFTNYGVFTGSMQITAIVWSANNGEILYIASGNTGKINSCALSNTGILTCNVKVPVGSFTHHLAVNPTNSTELFAATVASGWDFSLPAMFQSTLGGPTRTKSTPQIARSIWQQWAVLLSTSATAQAL
jgi:hypothetical protein